MNPCRAWLACVITVIVCTGVSGLDETLQHSIMKNRGRRQVQGKTIT